MNRMILDLRTWNTRSSSEEHADEPPVEFNSSSGRYVGARPRSDANPSPFQNDLGVSFVHFSSDRELDQRNEARNTDEIPLIVFDTGRSAQKGGWDESGSE